MSDKNIKKYLPSKKFQMTFMFFIVFLIIIFAIFYFIKNTNKYEKNSLIMSNPTIGELKQIDTDGDGVPDWEEKILGTDINNAITFENTPDSIYRENKRKELLVNTENNEQELTETDRFAREWYSSYNALKEVGGADENTLTNFSDLMSQKYFEGKIENNYTRDNIKRSKTDDLKTKESYYNKISQLFEKYEGEDIGEEINIMTKELENYSESEKQKVIDDLIIISESYKNMSQDLMNIEVPKSLEDYHLAIGNDLYKIGITVYDMSKTITDPIVAIKAISLYEEYSADLLKQTDYLKLIIQEKL